MIVSKKENNNLKIKYYDVSNKERGFRKRMKEKFLVIIFFFFFFNEKKKMNNKERRRKKKVRSSLELKFCTAC